MVISSGCKEEVQGKDTWTEVLSSTILMVVVVVFFVVPC